MFLTSNVRPSVFLPRNDIMSHDFSFVIIAQSVGAFLYAYFYMCISICVFLGDSGEWVSFTMSGCHGYGRRDDEHLIHHSLPSSYTFRRRF